jgi:type IV fimbrial biogenesis protein FimT
MQALCKPITRGESSGFGLLELVVVVSIIAILVALALPSFSSTMRNNRVSAQTNDLLSAINLARNEAITRSRPVTVCAADTSSGAPAECGSDWNKGWIVATDTAAASDDPEIEDVLKIWTSTGDNELTASNSSTFIRFDSRGQATTSPAPPISFTLMPADACSGDQKRSIVVTALGRSGSTKVDCT